MTPIFKKAIIESMQSMQFWILFIFSVFLFLVNGIMYSGKYTESVIRYDRMVAKVSPSTVQQDIYAPPAPLRFINDGYSSAMPSGYSLQPKGVVTPIPGDTINVRFPVLPPLDWTFIITFVFSLLVILLGYDSISGEREAGTLKLALSNPVSRARFCMAYYGAIMCITAVSLTAGGLVNLIVIIALHPELLSLDLFISSGMVIAAACLLCSFFAFISIAVSSIVRSSPIVLLILLVIWVCSGTIVPNTAPVIAKAVTRAPSEYQTASTVQQILNNDEKPLLAEVHRKVDRNFYHTVAELEHEVFTAYDELQNRIVRQYEAYDNAMKLRSQTARRFARISPHALFTYAVEGITRTGDRRDAFFHRAVVRYGEQYDRYILDKVGVLIRKSHWTFVSSFQFHGEDIKVMSPEPEDYKGNMRDFPRFQPPKFALSEGLFSAFGDIAVLALWNLLAAACAFAAVQRMDVR